VTDPGVAATPRSSPRRAAPFACVVLAHTDPVQLRRLVRALDPVPTFVHCDVRTPQALYREMVEGLPPHVRLLPRIRTGWARWENVAAELDGLARAIRVPGVRHVAVLSGTDYPIASVEAIGELLAGFEGRSLMRSFSLPFAPWGPSGGMSRLRYRHWAVGKRMIRLPVPRALPGRLVASGGHQFKVLAAEHARRVLAAAEEDRRLVAFFERSWIPDETFVPSVLRSPGLVGDLRGEIVPFTVWFARWGEGGTKSPRWLDAADLPALARARFRAPGAPADDVGGTLPRLFARKFSTSGSARLLDAIDATLRTDRLPDELVG
jgi:hypothetical protein